MIFKEVLLFYSNSTASLPSFPILKKSIFSTKFIFFDNSTLFLSNGTVSIAFYGKLATFLKKISKSEKARLSRFSYNW